MEYFNQDTMKSGVKLIKKKLLNGTSFRNNLKMYLHGYIKVLLYDCHTGSCFVPSVLINFSVRGS